jgi:hypothetical protein
MDDGAATQQDRATFTAWVDDPNVPGVQRLRAYVGSTELARANQAALVAIAANPGSATSMCS